MTEPLLNADEDELRAALGAAERPDVNPASELLEASDQELNQVLQPPLRPSLHRNFQQSPERATEAADLGRRFGVPASAVETDLESVRRQRQVEDAERVLERAPKTRETVLDLALGPAVSDDIDNLAALESVMASPDDHLLSGQQNGPAVTGGQLLAVPQEMLAEAVTFPGTVFAGLGDLNDAAAQSITDAVRALGLDTVADFLEKPRGIPDFLNPSEIVRKPGEVLERVGDDLLPDEEDRSEFSKVAGGVTQLGVQVALAIATGGTVTATTFLAQGAREQALRAEKADATESETSLAVILGSATTAGTEKLLRPLERLAKPIDRLLAGLPSELKGGIVNRFKDIVGSAGLEGAQEFLEAVTQNLVAIGVLGEDSGVFDGALEEGILAGESAGVFRALTSLVDAGVRGSAEHQRKLRAEQHRARLEAVFETANQTKTKERSPELFQEVFDKIAENSDIKETRVNVQGVDVFYQSAGDPDRAVELFDSLGIDPDVVARANTFGGDVVVNTAKLLEVLENEELKEGVLANVRANEDALTITEADAVVGDFDQQIESVVSEFAETDDIQAHIDTQAAELRARADEIVAAVPGSAEGRTDQASLLVRPLETFLSDFAAEGKKFDAVGFFDRLNLRAEEGTFEPGQADTLTQQADKVRRSPEFNEFFKDSKVVDEKGDPLVVFHGTESDPADIEVFAGVDGVAWFATNRDTAFAFGESLVPAFLSIENPADLTTEEGGVLWRQAVAENPDNPYQVLAAQGFDGVKTGDELGVSGEFSYLVFDPAQIKSVDNKGTFDPRDPNIFNQSAAPLQSDSLAVKGSGPGGRVTNFDLAEALTEHHNTVHGGPLDPIKNAEDFEAVVQEIDDELAEQFVQQDTGTGWYVEDIAEAIDTTKQVIPELAEPVNRDLFLTMTALLSPQQAPKTNWNNAVSAMQGFLKEGKIPLKKPNGKNFGVNSHRTGLQLLQHLIDTHGVEGALEWLQAPHSGREMAEVRRDSGLFNEKAKLQGYLPNETNMTEQKLGIYMMGPKVGDFMQNAVGLDQSAVTVDLWLARTYNRHVGRLLDVPQKKQEAREIASELRGRAERDTIKRLIRRVAGDLNVEPSAVQAALWYFEQRLYRNHGIQANSQNFADAARAAAEKRGIAVDGAGGSTDRAGEAQEANQRDRLGRRVGQEGLGATRRADEPLRGSPAIEGAAGPDPGIVAVVERYAQQRGIEHSRQAEYAEVDEARARRIAEAYEAMAHAPNDTAVQEAYQSMIDQVSEQYQALVDAGYTFYFINPANDPYDGNPWNAMRDLRANKRMGVFPTDDGFGSDAEFDVSGNLLMEETSFQIPFGTPDGEPTIMLANDVFRAVHDAFGHGLEGAGFRARGEENAWQAHVRLFTGPAVGAITSETRGQNSWLNFGPNGETNRTAKVEDTVFADQKMGLMPEWTWQEGRVPSEQEITDGQERQAGDPVEFRQSSDGKGDRGAGDDGARRVLTEPPVDADGKIRVVHFSSVEDLTEIDPTLHGNNLSGTTTGERNRKRAYGDLWVDRAYFGIAIGHEGGYVKEGGLGDNAYVLAFEPSELYDFFGDPDGFNDQITEAFPNDPQGRFSLKEKLVKEAGYKGFWLKHPDFGLGDGGMIGVTFEKIPVEKIGPNDGVLNQDDGTPRGSIRLADDETVIRLFQNSNLSTFLHEMGHLHVAMLERVAAEPDAPERIKKNFQDMLTYVGAESADDLNVNLKGDAAREKQETLARAFEAYLREGKAPSRDLQSAFFRFKQWLINIYDTVRRLNVSVDDRIRQVFDRLLATEAEITEAEERHRFKINSELFKEATPAERRAMEQLANEAHDEGVTEVEQEKARVERTAQKESRRQERNEVRLDVENALFEEQPYRAWYFFAHGGFRDGETPDAVRNARLNKGELQALGADLNSLVRIGQERIYKTNGQLDIDQAAVLFGYDTGAEFLEAMQALTPPGREIDARTDAIMAERHPEDDLNDGRLEELAGAAVHSEKRRLFITAELKAVARKAKKDAPQVRLIKEIVDRIFNEETVGDLLTPGKFNQAALRAAQKAERAIAAGDWETAFNEKRRHLLNVELFRRATKAKEEVEKINRFLNRRKRRVIDPKKIDPEFVKQIKELLAGYEVGSASRNETQRRDLTQVAEFIKRRQAEGVEVHVAADLLTVIETTDDGLATFSFNTKHWRDMSLDELRGLRDTVKSLEHAGKRNSEAEKQKFQEEMEAIADHILDHNKELPDRGIVVGNDRKSKRKKALRGFFADHRKLESLVRELDAQDFGPLNRTLFDDLAKAQGDEVLMKADALDRFEKIMNAYSEKERSGFRSQKKSGVAIDGLPNYLWSKEERLMLALNWGNEGNRAAVLQDIWMSEKFGEAWNAESVAKILATLDQRDWRVVKGIWAFVDSFWEPLKALEERTKGVAPKKVEPAPFTINDGVVAGNENGDLIVGEVVAGGYFPLTFDPDKDTRVSRDGVEERAKTLLSGGRGHAQTRNGSTIERVGSGGRPVLLAFDSVMRHLETTIHDLTYREAVQQADRVLRDKKITDAITRTKGKEVYDVMEEILKHTAAGVVPPNGSLDRILRNVRINMTSAVMGFNLRTIFTQPFGMTQSTERIGAKWVGVGLTKMMVGGDGYASGVKFVNELSPFMEERARLLTRELDDIVNTVDMPQFSDKVKQAGFSGIVFTDVYSVSYPTWLGAYEKAMAGKVNGIDAGDQESAVAFADSTVRTAQGAGGALNLSMLQQRNELTKLLTMFYGYFNTTYNMMAEANAQLGRRGVRGLPEWVGSMTMLSIVPAVLSGLVIEAWPDDDDLDEPEIAWAKWAMKQIAMYLGGTLVLGRDMVNSVASPFGFSLTPAESLFDVAARTGDDLSDLAVALFEDDDVPAASIAFSKNFARLISYAKGIPGVSQLIRIADTGLKASEGDLKQESRNPLELGQKLLLTGDR